MKIQTKSVSTNSIEKLYFIWFYLIFYSCNIF